MVSHDGNLAGSQEIRLEPYALNATSMSFLLLRGSVRSVLSLLPRHIKVAQEFTKMEHGVNVASIKLLVQVKCAKDYV